ncbi:MULTISPECIES: energy-coupling factor transporter transmembrane component T family protein [Kocuria]|jgi:biotin transport system permease protein|uniref:energy-coupling factor transporter transmembrane component T family protein n=1 Tax=Kocuria TaxID=57493 RepID=UPI00203F7275|nr:MULTISPECIES: energy-coupling factor transporter transmembrane component T [Kocuria]MCM3689440.1 energy-coupling factor transporter transmembrane protein EcfT [Kocuria rosea]HST72387.1 energy-coupling factor transporter transmembrane component T [Kocuria rosea]
MNNAQRTSPLSGIGAGYKFAVLFLASLALYATAHLGAQVVACAAAVVAVLLTRTPVARLGRMLGGLVLIVGIVVATLVHTTGWEAAAVAGLRLLSLCLLACAVTLSTPFSAMLALFQILLAPTRHLGANPAQMSLALSMTVRFIPQIRTQYLQIREAQFARGLHHHPVAVLVPLLVRTLESAQEIAAAIDARCYDSTPPARATAPPAAD